MIKCEDCSYWYQSRHHSKNGTLYGYCLNLASEHYEDLLEEYNECEVGEK